MYVCGNASFKNNINPVLEASHPRRDPEQCLYIFFKKHVRSTSAYRRSYIHVAMTAGWSDGRLGTSVEEADVLYDVSMSGGHYS